MASPQVLSITQTAFAVAATDHQVNMPASVPADSLILILFAVATNPSLTTPSGFTEQYNDQAGGFVRGAGYVKVAAGTEGGTTVNIVTSLARSGSAQVWIITDWLGTLAGVEDLTGGNPPTLTPSWTLTGADTNLYITTQSSGDDDQAVTVWSLPDNRTDTACGGGENASGRIAASSETSATTPFNPGDYTLASSESFFSATIAIRPGTAGTGSPRTVSGTTEELTLTGQTSSINRSRKVSAATEALTLTAHAATVTRASGRSVPADTEELTLTGQAASINRERGVSAATEELTLTAQAATVSRVRAVSAATEALTLTGQAATVTADASGELYIYIVTPDPVAANRITALPDIASGDQLHARGLGGGAAPTGLSLNDDATFEFAGGATLTNFEVRVQDVSDGTWGDFAVQLVDGGTRAVSAATEELTLTAFVASINATRDFTADTEELTLTAQPATVTRQRSVPGTTQSLTLTAFPATINRTRNVNANTEAVTLTASNASVTKGAGNKAFTGVKTRLGPAGVAAKPYGDFSLKTPDTSRTFEAATESLTLTAFQATVNRGRNVSTATESLTLTAQSASVIRADESTADFIGELSEVDIRRGGKQLFIVLRVGTYVESFTNEMKQAIIDGIVSNQNERNGWNNQVNIEPPSVRRLSDTVLTIDIEGFPAYEITAAESITATLPASSVILGAPQLASPAITIADADGDEIANTNAVTEPSNYVICERSGFRVYPGGLKKQWDGKMVRPESFETQHPQEFVRSRPEQSRGSERPEGEDIAVGDIAANDL